jgi:transcriptional regulator with XRE-family HTH domain
MFPDNLKRSREAAGFTQASFAKRMGVSLRTMQNWEQGHREPGLSELAELARVLGTTADHLLADTPGAPRSRGRPGAPPATPPAEQLQAEAKSGGRKRKGGRTA